MLTIIMTIDGMMRPGLLAHHHLIEARDVKLLIFNTYCVQSLIQCSQTVSTIGNCIVLQKNQMCPDLVSNYLLPGTITHTMHGPLLSMAQRATLNYLHARTPARTPNLSNLIGQDNHNNPHHSYFCSSSTCSSFFHASSSSLPTLLHRRHH